MALTTVLWLVLALQPSQLFAFFPWRSPYYGYPEAYHYGLYGRNFPSAYRQPIVHRIPQYGYANVHQRPHSYAKKPDVTWISPQYEDKSTQDEYKMPPVDTSYKPGSWYQQQSDPSSNPNRRVIAFPQVPKFRIVNEPVDFTGLLPQRNAHAQTRVPIYSGYGKSASGGRASSEPAFSGPPKVTPINATHALVAMPLHYISRGKAEPAKSADEPEDDVVYDNDIPRSRPANYIKNKLTGQTFKVVPVLPHQFAEETANVQAGTVNAPPVVPFNESHALVVLPFYWLPPTDGAENDDGAAHGAELLLGQPRDVDTLFHSLLDGKPSQNKTLWLQDSEDTKEEMMTTVEPDQDSSTLKPITIVGRRGMSKRSHGSERRPVA